MSVVARNGNKMQYKLLIIALAFTAAGIVALLSFSPTEMTDRTSYPLEPPNDSWRMYSFSPDGRNTTDVWMKGYWLRINGTQIDGQICNGYGGSIRYVDSSTIQGDQIFSTSALCGTLSGEESSIMEIERVFYEGLKNGISLSEQGNSLVLRDSLTNATFVYVKNANLAS